MRWGNKMHINISHHYMFSQEGCSTGTLHYTIYECEQSARLEILRKTLKTVNLQSIVSNREGRGQFCKSVSNAFKNYIFQTKAS